MINESTKKALRHPDSYRVGVRDGYNDALEDVCDWLADNLGYYDRNEVHFNTTYEECVINDLMNALKEQ